MSPSGKASPSGAKRAHDSSNQPQDVPTPTTSQSLKELVQQSTSESTSTFHEHIDPFNETFEHDADRPNSSLVANAQASAAFTNTTARSPSLIQRPASRPSSRPGFVCNRIDKFSSKPKPSPASEKLAVKFCEIAAENVRNEKEQLQQKGSPKPTSSQQDLEKAAAKFWTGQSLATEKDQEKSKNKPNQGTGKEKDKRSGRPRSQSIRLGRSSSNAVEAEDWEKDYVDLTGSYFEEPKEWLAARGLVSTSQTPPSPRPRPYDGENEKGDWDIPAINMNNSYNFDPNMNPNAARQAPNAAQAQQMNGMNGGQHWPNVGAQADMNVLWEYIQNLSQMHEGIRAQTQHVLNGVQQIQARAADDGDAPPHVNGVSNAGGSQVAEIARLQNELSSSNNKIDDLNVFVGKLQGLNQDYESALSHLMDKVRPFAQQHSQALLSQKAHYLHLIEEERDQNLELRLEQTRWQESASRINENLKEAMKALTEAELPYIRKIAALKADNKALRRICGVPLMDDSDEDDEEDGVEEAKENGVVVQHESPGQMEQVGRDRMLASLGQ